MMHTLYVGLIIGFLYTFCAFSSILMAIQISLRYGGISGFIAGLGHATAQVVWIIIAISVASLGVAALKLDISHYRFIAAAILFLFGVKLFFPKPKLKHPQEIANDKFKNHFKAYLAVFTVAISTPHRIIGYLVLFMFMEASLIVANSFVTKEILLLSTLLGIIVWWILFSIVMSKIKISSTERIQWLLQRIIALIFIIAAIIFCFYL